MVITKSELHSIIDYNEESGVFTWKRRMSQRVRAGDVATGRKTNSGYIQITISGRTFVAHHLAWLYVFGEWTPELDHINGIRDDNRIANLRKVSHAQNCQNKKRYRNNSSGYRGVTWCRKSNKWRAFVTLNKKMTHLGFFNSIDEAKNISDSARAGMFTHYIGRDKSP